jgi:arylsulfatase A-like enzyme
MNVIQIFSDSLRRDFLSWYGNTWTHTPHLDRFAREAIIFDRAYCGSFPTVPCRNDVFTSRWTLTYKPWSPLGDDEVVLAESLNQAGCLTALFADTPHPFAPGFNYQRGFQAWELIRGQEWDGWKTSPAQVSLPCSPHKLRGGERVVRKYLQNVSERQSEEDYFPARTMRKAAHWLENNRDRAFFLHIDTFDPHEPWDPPAHYLARYEPDGYDGEDVIYPRYDRWNGFLTEAELEHCRNLYAGEISLVDRWIGFLLKRVQDLGLLDQTVIIVTSDHGIYLGEHGYVGKSIIRRREHQPLPLYPEVCHVPLAIRLPGGDGARRSTAFVQPVDFMPTILELLDVPLPETVQGRSLVPVLQGDDDLRPFAVSSPTLAGPHVDVPHPTNRATFTTDTWALILGAQMEEMPSGEVTEMADGVERELTLLEVSTAPELYHLPSDPGCTQNVFTESQDVARRLQGQLVAFLSEAGMSEEHLAYYSEAPRDIES